MESLPRGLITSTSVGLRLARVAESRPQRLFRGVAWRARRELVQSATMESPYVRGFAICDFDIDVGQTTRLCEPPDCLTADEAHKIACLSLPDSNTSVFKDVVYTFRLRRFAARYVHALRWLSHGGRPCSDVIPLFSSTTLDHNFTFGCSFFRQRRDAASRRGFLQQSVVVLSRSPFVGLLKQVARVVGSHYLDADAGSNAALPRLILQAALEEVSRWPPPVPGTIVELPLLGCLLTLRVPWTGMAAHAPSLRPTMEDAPLVVNRTGRALSAPVASASSGGSSSLRRYSNASSGSDEAPAQREPPLVPVGASFSDVAATATQATPGLFQELGLFAVFRGLSPCLWHLWQLALTGQPILVMASSPEACGDAVLAIVSLIAPIHYCADFRPYFTLYDPDFASIAKLSNSVWGTHTRSPKLPTSLTASPAATSTAPPAVSPPALPLPSPAGAASPPLVIGTTNPFFTKALERWPNALWLGGAHGTSTAPAPATPSRLAASATHVPSAGTLMVSTGGPARTPTKGSTPRGSALPGFSTPRGYTPGDAKPRVIASAASLTTALPAPGQEMLTEARFVVRQPGALQPDANVLSSLLRVRAGDEDGVQLRLGGVTPLRSGRDAPEGETGAFPRAFGPGIAFDDEDAAGGGHIPAIIINNAILRQHFRQLTLAFLRPFERFFRAREQSKSPSVRPGGGAPAGLVGRGRPIPAEAPASAGEPPITASSVTAVRGYRTLGRIAPDVPPALADSAAEASEAAAAIGAGFGPYDDLSTLLLPRFDEATFMTKLEADGGPRHRLLNAGDWRTLYRGFMGSPHFHPWFNARRREACRDLHAIARTVRLQTTRDALLSGLGLARGAYDGMTWTAPACEQGSPSHDSIGSGSATSGMTPDARPRALPQHSSASSHSPPTSNAPTVAMRAFSMLPPSYASEGAARTGPLPRIVGRAVRTRWPSRRGWHGGCPSPPRVLVRLQCCGQLQPPRPKRRSCYTTLACLAPLAGSRILL